MNTETTKITSPEAAVIAIANYLQNNTLPKYYTPEEVAAVLNIKKETVNLFASQGRIKGYKVGIYWRFTPAQVIEFVEHSNQ